MSSRSSSKLVQFRKEVWKYWREQGRHELPWRHTRDPYKILISEVMLQQTQVDRVVPFYKKFLQRFPRVELLARAELKDVLAVWNGLGYNRRAKFLRDAARIIVEKHRGKVPTSYSELIELPGVGEYTAKAVRVFARNQSEVLIETNIRTALIHRFFPRTRKISDRDLCKYAEKASKGSLPGGGPRIWHWALMDYGAYLKQNGAKLNARSAHYVKQKKFKGSLRQIRGAILTALSKNEHMNDVRTRYGIKFDRAVQELAKDGLVEKRGKWWYVAQ